MVTLHATRSFVAMAARSTALFQSRGITLKISSYWTKVVVRLILCVLALVTGQAQADTPLIYVPLAQPCRLLDTRISSGGPGPLTQVHGNYQLFTDDAHIESATQNGSATGCGIPTHISAISVNFNMLNATAPGNIRSWADDQGTTGPSAGGGVYNPEVLYNTGYSTIDVGAVDGGFYVSVANGQIDMTVNVVGYWRPIGWGVTANGSRSTATGEQTKATGSDSTAMGFGTMASGNYSTAMGATTTASGTYSTAMGSLTIAGGPASTAMGSSTIASGNISTAMGAFTMAGGTGSTAMGTYANASKNYSFVWNGDSDSSHAYTSPSIGSFTVYAPGGVYVDAGDYGSGGCTMSNPGSAGWSCSSDRALKTNIVPVDARAVLDQVIGMPVAMWSFKTGPQYRHIGPMAQDFKTAFGLGDENDKSISTSDAQGVALAAIQGLNAKLERDNADKDRQIAELRAQVADLAAAIKHPQEN